MVAVIRKSFVPVRWFVTLEIGIWRSLFLLVTQRISGQRHGVRPFSYAKDIAPVMGAFIFVSMLELPVVHLLIPWGTVRLVTLVLSIWGLLWMVGLLASMKDVVLRAPTPVELPDGVEEISELRLYVDDPRAFVAAARERLAERAVIHGCYSSSR